MVEEDKYCFDVLIQVSADSRALQRVALGLLDGHLSHCVLDAARVGGAEQEAKLEGSLPTRSPGSSAPEDDHARIVPTR